MRTLIIVQARMASTRLPGKVLLPVRGKPLMAYLVDRLRRVHQADGLVIATSLRASDLPIVEFCTSYQVPLYRGSEDDVLGRYYGAAKEFAADVIVRVTADCPLIDPAVIDAAIDLYHSRRPDFDYVSNTQDRSFPRGMDVEVFSFHALREAYEMATGLHEREHVTPFIYERPDRYRLGSLKQAVNESALRWTVDTPDDFHLVQTLIEQLYPSTPEFSLEDMRQLVTLQPELKTLNAHVQQKAI